MATLNQLLADELTAINQYMVHAFAGSAGMLHSPERLALLEIERVIVMLAQNASFSRIETLTLSYLVLYHLAGAPIRKEVE